MRAHRSILRVAAVASILSTWASPAYANVARIITEQRTAPRVVELTISTPAFAVPTHVDVDLPVGYDSQARRRWPVTYILAGTMNTYATFNGLVHGVKLTQSFPAIVVSPNGDSGYWSDWYNGGAFGPPMYETYVIDQLIPLIDAHFRAIPDRSHRAVVGVSMGGDGAIMLAAEHPDLFADAASLSGAVDTNLPYIAGAVTVSPEFQGAPPDSIYGPRATQEIRWRGHNPVDLADNLRGLDLQVRTANGTPNPGIGENLLSADSVSCVIEQGVQQASISLNNTLNALRIPHIWRNYGPGCHTPPNFEREITDTLRVFARDFAHPPAAPARFDYASIQPNFDIWGWRVHADPKRALEFLRLRRVGADGLSVTGSGTTTITTPPSFRGLRRIELDGASPATVRPDVTGRIRFNVDLGAADAGQQFAPGVTTTQTSRTVAIKPYAVVRLARVQEAGRGVRICARAIGGRVSLRVRVRGSRGLTLTRSTRLTLSSRTTCRWLPWSRAPMGSRAILTLTGEDRFGHPVSTRRTIPLPARRRSRRLLSTPGG